MRTLPVPTDVVLSHFTARAGHYDRSSAWCTDRDLLDRVVVLANPTPESRVLDVAVGTGLVSRHFRPHVRHITGLDINTAMFEQARPHVDELVLSSAESMPLPDAGFDIVVCRQGIQFMDAPRALREMIRVVRPGGRVVLIDLCAYGPEDREEYFEILRLRNPARRNFFDQTDVARLLSEAGASRVETHTWISREDVDVWSDNRAIDEARREAIRDVYRKATPAFLALHHVATDGGAIVDHMLFGITVGTR